MKLNAEKTSEHQASQRKNGFKEDAYRELFEQYHGRVLHVALRLCGNVQEAEDVAQEIFLKVYQRLGGFRKESDIFTWIYRITVNSCLDKNRKRHRREKYHAQADFNSDGTNPEHSPLPADTNLDQQVWQDEIQHILQTALTKITPKLRAVIVLKDIEGLSYGEIAHVVRCSEGTISSRLNRGRKRLKRILGQMGIDKTYFQES